MTTNQTIDGVSRKSLEQALKLAAVFDDGGDGADAESARGVVWILRALLDAPADTRAETVPKHKFDTLVQHCKRLDGEIAQARAHVNEITLYQQNAVWFWQHDGEDFLESLSCPIIIQPHHLRELLKGVVRAAQPQGEPVVWMRAESPGMCISDEVKTHNSKIGGAPAKGVEMYTVPLYAEQPAPVAVVPELTSELRWILGQMCFQHIHTAQALRSMGHQIARKAEDEQAVTIYWMLGHYLKDPENWRENATAEMKAAAPAA